MSRLTKRTENGVAVYATPSGEPVKWENNRHKVLQKLAEYEDLEEKGLLLKLPCKIGTTVYDIHWWDDKTKKVKVGGKTYYKTVRKRKVSKTKFSLYDYEDFGKTVFLTMEEAEQELKRLESAE